MAGFGWFSCCAFCLSAHLCVAFYLYRGTEKAKQRLVTDEDGTRAISRDIERNKGLLPSRKKEYRNPRVRQRKRFQRAQKKRKARVKEAVGEVPSYRGEATGIRRTVIKSVALH